MEKTDKVEKVGAGLKTSFVSGDPTPTTALCGAKGSITIASLTGEIQNWTFDYTVDVHDVTSMNSNSWKEHIGCLKGGGGTYETYVPMGTLGMHAGASFDNVRGTYTADIIIKSVGTTVDVNDVVKFVYAFDVTGTIDS